MVTNGHTHVFWRLTFWPPKILWVAAFALGAMHCGDGIDTSALGTSKGGPSCTATTCAAAGKNCGDISDGCGGTLSCGTCSGSEICGGAGTPNVCGEVACTPTSCGAEGKNCGTMPDGCGGTLACGACSGGETCGGDGIANVCGEGTCAPTTCAVEGKNCGTISDGCSGTLACGSCVGVETCGGAGVANVCGESPCEPTTCAAAGKNCGDISDGCGGTLSCGTCSGSETCGGAGVANVCGEGTCTPTTCAAAGKDCGDVSDGCGGTISCGTCAGAETCGGGGEENVCGEATCSGAACLESECAGHPECTTPLVCPGYPSIACGSTVVGATLGGTHVLESYDCAPGTLWSGPERYYWIDGPPGVEVRAQLVPVATVDLDLFAVALHSSECAVTNCLAAGIEADTNGEDISFVLPETGAFLVVETVYYLAGYELWVTCQWPS